MINIQVIYLYFGDLAFSTVFIKVNVWNRLVSGLWDSLQHMAMPLMKAQYLSWPNSKCRVITLQLDLSNIWLLPIAKPLYCFTLFHVTLTPLLWQVLELDNITTHHWLILDCSAVTGHNLLEGIDWTINDIASRIFTADWTYLSGNIYYT